MLSVGYMEPAPPSVWPTGIWGQAYGLTSSSPVSATFESANRALYFPISVPTVCVAKRMWWANVSASYNVDAGIYRDNGYKPGARLASTGSTAQGTATEVQFADITDTVLTPGPYWLAFTCSSTSATFLRSSPNFSTVADAFYRFEEASALPLPATATPAESSGTNIYLFGFSTTTIT
jgi:hypothetical protein